MKHLKNKLFSISLIVFLTACSSLPQKAHHEGLLEKKHLTTKKVVFIHGMFTTPTCWENWLPLFSKNGYDVRSPAWPLHDLPIEEQRDPKSREKLGNLSFDDLLNHYRRYLKTLNEKPILIGHSLGGLIAQILANEGLASAVIAIHPAPPNGLLVASWPFLRSNWAIISPFTNVNDPIVLDQDQFSYRFTNAESEELQKTLYEKYYVPESRRAGRGATEKSGVLIPEKLEAPLLLIAGSADHIIPETLVYKNYELYEKSPGVVDYESFNGRDHFTIGAPGWEAVVDASLKWLASFTVK